MLSLPRPWAGGSPPKSPRTPWGRRGTCGGSQLLSLQGVIQGHIHLSKCQILDCLELGDQFGVVVGGFLAVWEGGDAQLQYPSAIASFPGRARFHYAHAENIRSKLTAGEVEPRLSVSRILYYAVLALVGLGGAAVVQRSGRGAPVGGD